MDPSNFLHNPGNEFFTELTKALPDLKCINPFCADKETKTMYNLCNNAQGVEFVVAKDKVCCPKFEQQLKEFVEATYQKYK